MTENDRKNDLPIIQWYPGHMKKARELVEENVDVADIVPLTRALFRWIQSLTFSKLVNLSNVETGKEA